MVHFTGAWTVPLAASPARVVLFVGMQSIPYTGSRCVTTLLRSHSLTQLPQQWNGDFFIDQTLFDLGLSYQLGHDVGDPCLLPSTPISLTLFDISGTHTVRIAYCFCNKNGVQSGNRRVQLLRARWFPASWSRPGTAFTFKLLDFIHKLQTRSKINLYDFYSSLVSTTNDGLRPPLVRHHIRLLPCD